MTWSELLISEFSVTVSNPAVWLSISLALALGAACWVFGAWVARTVGLLDAEAPPGESLAVGLVCGLMVGTAWWAAAWSGGRSSFTPAAIGFAVALGLALARRTRRPSAVQGARSAQGAGGVKAGAPLAIRWQALAQTALFAGLFVIGVALLYGSTIAPSPRDGLQPMIERDTAYYAILGRDLATTGIETNLGPSGFVGLLPVQVWYHWGEAWLSSAVISVFGMAPMAARHFVVLPIVLLATAAMAGTLVRRLANTDSRAVCLFGFFVLLVLAPFQFDPTVALSAWAVGLGATITIYGMGAAAALHAMYCRAVLGRRAATWSLAAFVGSAVAFILPAHIAIAVLGGVGVAAALAGRIASSLLTARRLPVLAPIWYRSLVAAAALTAATAAWGVVTEHGLGGSGAATSLLPPFSSGWQATIVLLALEAVVFFAIPLAWWLSRSRRGPETDLYLGVMALLVAGAIGWGVRNGEFTMFYLLFAGIAVYATPIAALALWRLNHELRRSSRRPLASILVAVTVIQLSVGATEVAVRLEALGVGAEYKPIPTSIIDTIAALPSDAKLAYSCGPAEEISFGVPKLVTIDALTARRVVPMCFEPEFPNVILGARPDLTIPSQFFRGAPQMELYPTSTATPSRAAILDFLAERGIGYIYADARHPNTLVSEALPVASSGDVQVLQVP